jgi:hypothetical protein
LLSVSVSASYLMESCDWVYPTCSVRRRTFLMLKLMEEMIGILNAFCWLELITRNLDKNIVNVTTE